MKAGQPNFSARSAGFQTCCIADFKIGGPLEFHGHRSGSGYAGLETRDTADLEVCVTQLAPSR